MGIPLSITIVARVRLNLLGYTLQRSQAFAVLTEPHFNTADLQAFMWLCRDTNSAGFSSTAAVQAILQVDFRPCIKVHDTLFVSLAEYHILFR